MTLITPMGVFLWQTPGTQGLQAVAFRANFDLTLRAPSPVRVWEEPPKNDTHHSDGCFSLNIFPTPILEVTIL